MQHNSIIRHCIGLMRSRVLTATLAAWQRYTAMQRSLRERLQQAEAQRHAKLRGAMLRQWAVVAVAKAAQHRKLLLVVGTMQASSLARCRIRHLYMIQHCIMNDYSDQTLKDGEPPLLPVLVCCLSENLCCSLCGLQVISRLGGRSGDAPPPPLGAGQCSGPPGPPRHRLCLRQLGQLGAELTEYSSKCAVSAGLRIISQGTYRRMRLVLRPNAVYHPQVLYWRWKRDMVPKAEQHLTTGRQARALAHWQHTAAASRLRQNQLTRAAGALRHRLQVGTV